MTRGSVTKMLQSASYRPRGFQHHLREVVHPGLSCTGMKGVLDNNMFSVSLFRSTPLPLLKSTAMIKIKKSLFVNVSSFHVLCNVASMLCLLNLNHVLLSPSLSFSFRLVCYPITFAPRVCPLLSYASYSFSLLSRAISTFN